MLSRFLSLLFLSASLTYAAEPVISLFNGKDLSGWEEDVPESDGKADAKPTFIVRDGVLVSTGKPLGHLITKKSFSNYTLTIEYRYSEKLGNCGVMIHSTTPRFLNKVFPRSIEVQLMAGNAGDFICIGEDITGSKGKSNPQNIGKEKTRAIKNLTDNSEKPVKEWNKMVIHCQGDSIVVTVNGDIVNVGTRSSVSSGKIAFQSEGVPVEFRKVELQPLQKKK